MSVYKPCDIRGPLTELSSEMYYTWGRLIGNTLATGAHCVTGGDIRPSSREFLAALEKGLKDAGIHVLSLGIVPTPIVYFMKRTYTADAAAIVTASHSPPNTNGLKWLIGCIPPQEEDVRQLEEMSKRELPNLRAGGTIETLDPMPHYLNWLKGCFFDDTQDVIRRIVIDFGNGCWALGGSRYVKMTFPQTDLVSIHDIPDGTFPSRVPDCSKPEHLHLLSKAVTETNADIGFAFDGDGDRVGFVDEEAVPLSPEESTFALLQSFSQSLKNTKFVYDIKFSDTIAEAASNLGASPIPERSGHTFIRARMIKEDATFGAEISGHYFYKALGYGDDGMYSACRLVHYLKQKKLRLSDLRKRAPKPHITQDIRLEVRPDVQTFMKEIKGKFSDMPLGSVDGLRVNFPNGWALARPSVTESKITFRFEGKTQQDLEDTIRAFASRVPAVQDQLFRALNIKTQKLP